MRNLSDQSPLFFFRAILVLLACYYAFLIVDHMHWWLSLDDYGFGFTIPFLVLYVLYERRGRIFNIVQAGGRQGIHKQAESISLIPEIRWILSYFTSDREKHLTWILNLSAWLMFAAGIVFFLFSTLYRAAEGPQLPVSFLLSAGLVLLAFSLVFLTTDRDGNNRRIPLEGQLELVLLFFFPCMIWLLSTPPAIAIQSEISLFLQQKVVVVVFWIIDIFGFPIERQGSLLIMPSGEVGIEDACSGIRSLTACLVVGSFLAAISFRRLWKKIILVIAAMGLAFFTNILRSLFLTLWAYHYGSDSLSYRIHDASGYAVLFLTLFLLIAFTSVLNFRLYPDEKDKDTTVLTD